jgi:hypothetical protein
VGFLYSIALNAKEFVMDTVHSALPYLLTAPVIWLAGVLDELTEGIGPGIILLTAVKGAKVGVNRTEDGMLRGVIHELDHFELYVRVKAMELFKRYGARVPDASKWGGAFVPAWLPFDASDKLLGICADVRKELDPCEHPHRKPIYTAIGATSRATTMLIRTAKDDQIVVSAKVMEIMGADFQREATERQILSPMEFAKPGRTSGTRKQLSHFVVPSTK